MKFAEKLRECRKAKGLLQKDLAAMTGISLRTIANYENGSTYPRVQSIYDTLAKALDVDIDYLKNEYDGFITDAAEKYGNRGLKQAEKLVNDMGGLFAGGELSEEDIDGVMRAMQELYWMTKEKNKKYTPKKYIQNNENNQ